MPVVVVAMSTASLVRTGGLKSKWMLAALLYSVPGNTGCSGLMRKWINPWLAFSLVPLSGSRMFANSEVIAPSFRCDRRHAQAPSVMGGPWTAPSP